jgi:hypothetical protein
MRCVTILLPTTGQQPREMEAAMTALLSRARDAAISNLAEAALVITVTGSSPAALATFAGSQLRNLVRRSKRQPGATQGRSRMIN